MAPTVSSNKPSMASRRRKRDSERTRLRWAARAMDRTDKRRIFVTSLKELDTSVKRARSALEIFLISKKDFGAGLERRHVSELRDNMVDLLNLMIADREVRGLGLVQVRSATILRDKIAKATNARTLSEALEYFNSQSCMLKLPTQ